MGQVRAIFTQSTDTERDMAIQVSLKLKIETGSNPINNLQVHHACTQKFTLTR